MLSEEHDDTTFRLSLTRRAERPPLLQSLRASFPSFVFRDSLDIGTFEGGDGAGSPDLGEEQEGALQEQIERAVAEAATKASRDEDTDR